MYFQDFYEQPFSIPYKYLSSLFVSLASNIYTVYICVYTVNQAKCAFILICPKGGCEVHTSEQPAAACHNIPFRQVMENNEALLLECYQSWPCFV